MAKKRYRTWSSYDSCLVNLFRNIESGFIFQVPGFQRFIIETFAANCCLYSVLDKSFEFRDANSVSTSLSLQSNIRINTV